MSALRQGSWRKSSRSNGRNGACVEVARTANKTLLRDSKNPSGTRLAFGVDTVVAHRSH
ncbi:DUF397 domain-containing protein [Saccharothrix ecbatanensis]|nr:DUF397 domain-containing protein [Saccharothrix ecbatanensis]